MTALSRVKSFLGRGECIHNSGIIYNNKVTSLYSKQAFVVKFCYYRKREATCEYTKIIISLFTRCTSKSARLKTKSECNVYKRDLPESPALTTVSNIILTGGSQFYIVVYTHCAQYLNDFIFDLHIQLKYYSLFALVNLKKNKTKHFVYLIMKCLHYY